MTTLTFAILDSSVTKENQVFDHLVSVKRLDTQEEGRLLCSHCCKWPMELVSSATWLEGCYTPSRYEGDTRLLMGYHPNHLTKWMIDWEAREVTLSLVGTSTSDENTGSFPIPYSTLDADSKLYHRVAKYLSRVPLEDSPEDYLRSLFSFLVNLYQRTGDMGLVLAAPAWLQDNNPYPEVNIHFTEGEWYVATQQETYRTKGASISREGFFTGPSHYLPWVNNQGYDTFGGCLLMVFEDVGPWAESETIQIPSQYYTTEYRISIKVEEDLIFYWELEDY
jgi:hypothetical protein